MSPIPISTPAPKLNTPQPGGKQGNLIDTSSTQGGQVPGPSASEYAGSNYGSRPAGQKPTSTSTKLVKELPDSPTSK